MRSFLAAALLTAALAAGPAAAADPPSVKAYSLSVTRPPKDLAPGFFINSYTSVGLLASLPEKSIIGLDTGACKLTFADDKGTDLTTDGKVVGLYPGVYVEPRTKSQAQVFLGSAKVPGAGAAKVKVKGDLVFLCGTGEKTASAAGFAIQAKEKKTVGPATFEVLPSGTQNYVQITTESPVVKTITVLDKDGKPAGTAGVYVGLNKDGKVIQSGTYYPLPNAQAVDIKITYYEKVEAVTVPVDVQMGVGD